MIFRQLFDSESSTYTYLMASRPGGEALIIDPVLDNAAKQALREMIVLIQEKANLSKEDAYMLCSLAADLRISQTVNVHKGVHVMLKKSALHG